MWLETLHDSSLRCAAGLWHSCTFLTAQDKDGRMAVQLVCHLNLTLLMSYGAHCWGARRLSFTAVVGLCSNPSTPSGMQWQSAECHSHQSFQ